MKPYGYVWTSLKDSMETRFTNMYPNEFYKPFDIVPVYTHPVKELTLTEDEIDDVWAACSTGESDTIDMHLFAEAILKKAQEK